MKTFKAYCFTVNSVATKTEFVVKAKDMEEARKKVGKRYEIFLKSINNPSASIAVTVKLNKLNSIS